MTCEKIAYETYRLANAAAVLIKKRLKGRHLWRPYKCKRCNCFHITTVTKRLHTPRKLDKYPIRYTLPKKGKKGSKKHGKRRQHPRAEE